MKNWVPLLIFGLIVTGVVVYFVVTSKTTVRMKTPPRKYDNEEIREIEYNAEGLPSKITIHRHAAVA
jgi:hypothetical protein